MMVDVKALHFFLFALIALVIGIGAFLYFGRNIDEGDTIFWGVSISIPEKNVFVTLNQFANDRYEQVFTNSDSDEGTLIFDPADALGGENGNYVVPFDVTLNGETFYYVGAFSPNVNEVLTLNDVVFIDDDVQELVIEERGAMGLVVWYSSGISESNFVYILKEGDSFMEGYRVTNAGLGAAFINEPTPHTLIAGGGSLAVSGEVPRRWFTNDEVTISLFDDEGNALVRQPAPAGGQSHVDGSISFATDLIVPVSYQGLGRLDVSGNEGTVSVPIVIGSAFQNIDI